MNIKLLTVITILSIWFIFGFEEISYGLNKANQNDISELKILKYIPKDNKTFFISNSKIPKLTNDIRKNYETKEQDKLILIKNSILAYLGIDLGTNKVEDIYDDELTISTYENKEKDLDDVLIIFKIKETKDINDVLNITNKIYESNKLIKILRYNKLNYLKYIYRTNENYILTSSNKKLILDALKQSNIDKKIGTEYISLKKLLKNFKNQHNIFLSKNNITNELLNNENYPLTKDDYLLTLFKFKDKEIILKSYLVNNKSLNFMSYKEIEKEDILDKENYQISIFNLLNSKKYLDNIKINSFEKGIFKELSKKVNQNLLLLISEDKWLLIFDKNSLSIDNINLLEDFNKNSLENNNNIFTIYSKDTLKKEENIIRKSSYNNIFSVESDKLNFISNSLINDEEIELISKVFFNFRGDRDAKYILNKKINLKKPYNIKLKNLSYLENINYFLKNVINISITEFKATINQSIPETTPIYYAETNLKIF